MNDITLKNNIELRDKKGLLYAYDNETNKKQHNSAWLSGFLTPFYDWSMRKVVFPSKFNASINRHKRILKLNLHGLHGKKIIEFAPGNGNAVHFLFRDNSYTGIDVSRGLLRIAKKRLRKYGFKNPNFYVGDASETPFADNQFDVAICNLSMNFFKNIHQFIDETKRVLKNDGFFFASVPATNRVKRASNIHGQLFSEAKWRKMFQDKGFQFETLPYENGALLYFKATNTP